MDFRSHFRMWHPDSWARLELGRSDLETNDDMVVLLSGILMEIRVALALWILAGGSCFDVMFAFVVGRSPVYKIYHQVCRGGFRG